LNRIEQARARAQTLFIDGVITRERLDQELARFDREVAALPDSPAPPSRQNSRHLQAVARSLEEHWATWSNESKRELLQEMIHYIVLNRSDLAASEIAWRSVGWAFLRLPPGDAALRRPRAKRPAAGWRPAGRDPGGSRYR
jgi:hypothetical protein